MMRRSLGTSCEKYIKFNSFSFIPHQLEVMIDNPANEEVPEPKWDGDDERDEL